MFYRKKKIVNMPAETITNFNTPEAKIAQEVASQFISKKVGRCAKFELRKEVEILLRLSKEIDCKYGVALNNMCNKLDVTSDNAYIKFSTVAEEILNGDENWGRIIILYAFAAKLAEQCKQTNNEQMIDKIINWLSCFIAKKSSWIRDTGKGWNGFIDQFHEPCNSPKETGWVHGLFAATVGLGTLAAVLLIKSS